MQPNQNLYQRLRQDLLRSAKHHRKVMKYPTFATDLHESHLHTCQRQLGALRQAYRRTQEALAWEQYKRSIDA